MERLILFAKRPVRGTVKTRLVPVLGESGALALYRAFLEDSVGLLRAMPDDVTPEVWLDGPGIPEPFMEGLPVREQSRGDLGQRLHHAFEAARREGAIATVVIGADSPTLPRSLVLDAFEALRAGADLSLAPSVDGGYVLIGLRRPRPELFGGITWSGPDVTARTLARAGDAGLRSATLETWYDVDDADGLARLRAELATPGANSRAPATRRQLTEPGTTGV